MNAKRQYTNLKLINLLFQLLLGQKYGPTVLRDWILASELDAMCDTMEEADAAYVKSYYKLDQNAKPPRYAKVMDTDVGEDFLKAESKLRHLLKVQKQ